MDKNRLRYENLLRKKCDSFHTYAESSVILKNLKVRKILKVRKVSCATVFMNKYFPVSIFSAAVKLPSSR